MKSWWHPETFDRRKPLLEQRMRMIRAIRAFFEGRDYWEVETPALQVSPCMDAHIRAFKTELQAVDQQSATDMYLHTSPEFAMKKLLVAGLPKIFQLCRTFRNAEGARTHEPEFTMLEWYATGMNYRELMDECVDLIRACAKAAGEELIDWRGRISDPFGDWQFISVSDAFDQYAGIDLKSVMDDLDAFGAAAAKAGYPPHEGDTWDDIFFRVFLPLIEPNLGHPVPTILYDYPATMASLARRCKGDQRFCERFEIYICGLELANAFGELTDPVEQRSRFVEENIIRKELYGDEYPVDAEFIAALEFGLPDASGIALGVDRLAMLLTGADDIADIIWTPVRPVPEAFSG